MKFLLINSYPWPRDYRRLIYLTYLLFALPGGQAAAQIVTHVTESLHSDRPEAWAMNYVTSLTLLSGLNVPRSRAPGSIEVGAELDWIPQLSSVQRRVAFNGIGEVDVTKAPIFARPRITIGLPWQFALTLSYVPPIRVFGVKPNLFAFALERPLYERDSWTIGMRMYGQIGDVEGAVTCPGNVIEFPPGSPENFFGCEKKSADRLSQHSAGLELSGSYRIEQLRGLTPYIAVAGNFLDTQVRVNALTFGILDRNRLEAETWTFSASAGVTYPLTNKLMLSVGMFYSPLWVTRPPATSSHNDGLLNVRALLTYQLK